MSLGPSPIRVLTVDDHPLVREGIAGLIGVQPDRTLVGEAGNGRDAIQGSAVTMIDGLEEVL